MLAPEQVEGVRVSATDSIRRISEATYQFGGQRVSATIAADGCLPRRVHPMSIAPRWSRLLATVSDGSTSAIVQVSATERARAGDTERRCGSPTSSSTGIRGGGPRPPPCGRTCRRSGEVDLGEIEAPRLGTPLDRRETCDRTQLGCAVMQHCPGRGRGAGPRATASPTARRTCTHHVRTRCHSRVRTSLAIALSVIALREGVRRSHTTPSRGRHVPARHGARDALQAGATQTELSVGCG